MNPAQIGRCREKGWEFLFLGANMDAVKTAGAMGSNWRKKVDEDYRERKK